MSRAYLGLGATKNAVQSCDEALTLAGADQPLLASVRNQQGDRPRGLDPPGRFTPPF
jgi:hypothetical protein